MTPEELINKLNSLQDSYRNDCIEIIAETAVAYFKNTFRTKQFDGNSWRRTNKKTGSTLIESGNLLNSLRTIEVSESRVVIAAGNDKVAYARVHNEGGVQNVKAHTRTRNGKQHNVKAYQYTSWKRQYMGNSVEMFELIDKKINNYITTKLKS